jgi:excisionase family DNA binding protein
MPRPQKIKRHIPLRELLSSGDLIAPEELAAGMKVARVTVYSWVRRGAIPHLKLEGSVRFEPESIKKWLESKQNEAKSVMI